MSTQSYEGGIRPSRIEFVRESDAGATPSDPSYQPYGPNVSAYEPQLSPQMASRMGLGDPDTNASHVSVEEGTLSVTYDLGQWLVGGSGNAQDAAYDAFARDSDNRLPNTHTVVSRIDQSDLDASNTVNGSTSYDSRQYFVGKGGRVDEATISLDTSDTPVWQVELTYAFEKARTYKIDQPDSSKQLDVTSTDANDTMDLTIEDEGASTTEDVTLTGTGTATTTSSFSNIDALELASEPAGTVSVSISGGDTLANINGTSDYDHDSGDLGVPALGSGSHATALTSYELGFDGDTIERPSGTALAANIATHELSVANNVEASTRSLSPFPALSAGGRDLEIAATVYGEAERFPAEQDMMQSVVDDYVWTPSSGDSLTASNVNVLEVSGSQEARQGRMEVDLTLGQQEGVTIA